MVIHIVSGDSAFASIKYMLESSQSKNHVVLRHYDDLSIGPLFDVDSINPSARMVFWENYYRIIKYL
ncbi:MAG: DUF1835 domain-containing protein [Rickettsia endosymbiont of Ixodes persulcatus]|nr:DUF1835 domain-containing protein [Rickettsia endosymbiont of Ixodes persulcatus]MCZ6902564.1 DUF1835 domain-containing protein [Rickettsia endosymbiont of Ixodes persulcatus]MCZ6903219.1 DUF1835 domain-containing protein [Rickettsia endosymbiont of Ixodes persulcatus]MCZ6908511.1 DUF1835 domain-containing protein [Rickettsia endosymbiont of Ixodes persulcatus]MCZ6909615.1 DUF1835 domain-containing protein [Rickettsia endosymbiont of Ixodes persulcatus]